MIRIKVVRRNKSIAMVECAGHSGYGEEGSDIVCAAVSAITQTALLGLINYVNIIVDYTIDSENAHLSMKLPVDISQQLRHDCDIILETMLLGLQDLCQGFSDFIELEVR